MPFLLAEILNFQGSTHHIGVGSFSSLITNYSILKPELTNPYVLSGDNRYEKAKDLLQGYGENFSISNAFDVLRSVRQEGLWATRVSFIYSVAKNKVYYVLNNDFKNIAEYQF